MKRNIYETDEQYLERLTNLPNFNKTVFKRYVVEDCLKRLNSIKHLNNIHVNQVIDLIQKWLNDPTKVTEQQFRSAANDVYFAGAYTPANPPPFPYAYSAPTRAAFAASAAAWDIDYVWAATHVWEETRENKLKQYLRYAKSLLIKPILPKPFINYLLNYKTEEELNVILNNMISTQLFKPILKNYTKNLTLMT